MCLLKKGNQGVFVDMASQTLVTFKANLIEKTNAKGAAKEFPREILDMLVEPTTAGSSDKMLIAHDDHQVSMAATTSKFKVSSSIDLAGLPQDAVLDVYLLQSHLVICTITG